MIQRVAQKYTPKCLHRINNNHAHPPKKMKKQLFGKIGAISSKLAAPSRKISMKRPSLAVSGPNPSELWKRYWKKVADIIFWGCTFSAQLIYWVRKFEVLSPTQKTRFVDLGVVKSVVGRRSSGSAASWLSMACVGKNQKIKKTSKKARSARFFWRFFDFLIFSPGGV